jgi:hypothetical protein
MPYLPEKYRLLPLLQSVWYIPAGLDIWNQLLGKYPGRYATMKGINVPPPSYGPVVWQEAIMALDFPRATALANAYLRSGADRNSYQQTLALAACRFQDDPHNQKITISTFEEYAHNSTHLRDRLLLATARLLAGWTKMPGERDCYARFEKDWIYH